MKNFFWIVFLSSLFISCSVDGSDTQTNFTLLKVQDFDVPTSFKVDSTSVFKVRYKRQTDCQIFNGLYFDKAQNTVKIAIKIVEVQQTNCHPDYEAVYEVPLNFKPSQSGTYIFNFWTGKGANGEDQFSNTEIIVP